MALYFTSQSCLKSFLEALTQSDLILDITVNPSTRTVWLYGKANICLSKQVLSNLPLIKESDDIDEFWKRWSTHIMSVMQKCIPKRIVPVDRPTPRRSEA